MWQERVIRVICAGIIFLPALAVSQQSWTHLDDDGPGMTRFVDVELVGDVVVVIRSYTPAAGTQLWSAHLVVLDGTGQQVNEQQVLGEGTSGTLDHLRLHPDGEVIQAAGVFMDSLGLLRFFTLRTDQTLAQLDTMSLPSTALISGFIGGMAHHADGDLCIVGAGSDPDLGIGFANSLWFYKFDPGGALQLVQNLEAQFIYSPSDLIALGQDRYLMPAYGGVNLSDGAGTLSVIDRDDLSLISLGPTPVFHGGELELPGSQHRISNSTSVLELPLGRVLLGGASGNLLPDGYISVVHIMEPDGTSSAYFWDASGLGHDHGARNGSIDTDVDGNIFFARMARFELGPPSAYLPTQPNRVDVFKLDTALNLLCRYEVDGFADNYYYFVDRIKATPDGGFILVGGRSDLTQPVGNFSGWVRKFSAEECVTAVAEHGQATEAVLYPNPGREGFTVLLNGPVVQGARLQLWDGMGRHVLEVPLVQGRASMDASQLAPGLYPYVITDAQGRRLASGRWVKE